MQVPLFGGTGKGVSVASSTLEFINCYEVPTYGTRNQAAIIGSPGTSLLDTGAGNCRGMLITGNYVYMVLGESLYRMGSTLELYEIGAVVGGDRVSMAAGKTQLVIVTGAGEPGYYYTLSTGVLAQITDADFVGGNTVAEQDGYFVVTNKTNYFYISNLDDGSAWDALDFAGNTRSPDNTVAVWSDHGELFFFGQRTIEPWLNSGNVDFTFERNYSASIERGTCAPFSIAKDDNTLFFVGDDRVVYRLEGYTPSRVSNDAVDNDLCRYSDGVIGGAYSFIYTDHGHKFYVLTIPGYATHVYNIATGSWHKRRKYGLDYWHVSGHAFAFGKHIVGTSEGAGVYDMSREYFSDDGNVLELKHVSNVIHDQNKRFSIGKLQYIIESGVGDATGDGHDPQILVRFSKDDGRTYGNEKLLPMGNAGAYFQRCINRCNGSARSLCIETRITAPVKRVIVDAYVEVGSS